MTDDKVDCCPECRNGALRTRNPGHPSSRPDVTEKYKCKECGHEFDTPDRRPRMTQRAGAINKDTTAWTLLNTDPDDVLGGERA